MKDICFHFRNVRIVKTKDWNMISRTLAAPINDDGKLATIIRDQFLDQVWHEMYDQIWHKK